MTLKKVIKEEYVVENRHGYNPHDDDHLELASNPAIAIKKSLQDYLSNHDHFNHNFDIPSIPGGKLRFVERNGHTIDDKYFLTVAVNVHFHYLESAKEEDVQFIRDIITSVGLERVI